MWENRCKIAVSGVGYSKVTRSAEIPLAAHALTAVKEAVADSGLRLEDIDGLATYPELPATGHAEIDGYAEDYAYLIFGLIELFPQLFQCMIHRIDGCVIELDEPRTGR